MVDASPMVPQDDTLHPALQQTVDSVQNPDVQDWATGVAQTIQQHVNQTTVADLNQAAGNQFVQNLADTKNQLVGMVKSDPTSLDLALKLTPQLVGPLLQHANVPDEQFQDTHDSIVGHINQAATHAAIIRMSDFDSGAAKGMIDKYGEHLDEGDAATLGRYADTLQGARDTDHALGTAQLLSDRRLGSRLSAYSVGSQLLDPSRETVGFPDNYVANLVRNTAIQPDDKQALYTAVTNLQRNGDQPSDPYTVMRRLQQIANQEPVTHQDLMDQVGRRLSYVDAHMLQGINLGATPEGNQAATQLSRVVTDAQRQLAGSGDRAGNAAFGRFMDWFLPSFRNTGSAGLNPDSDNYLFKNTSMAQFERHEDAVQGSLPPGVDRVAHLHSLFAGDVEPIRPQNQMFQGVPGVTGAILDQMRKENMTGYSVPGKLPVTMPEAKPGTPANG